jgi:hypothetical protein
MKFSVVIFMLGVILIVIGIYQWQDGLNMQKLTLLEQKQIIQNQETKSRISSGEDKEVIGMTLFTGGIVVTLASGVVLLKGKGSETKAKNIVEIQKCDDCECDKCGGKVHENDKFCPHCGVEFD